MSDLAYFIGVTGEYGGRNVQINAYIDEGDPIDALNQVIKVADEIGINNQVVTNGGNGNDSGLSYDTEPVDMMVRRTQRNRNPREGQPDTTPCVDLYPAIKVSNSDPSRYYGKYKKATVYMNNDSDIEAFENATGLKFDDLPNFAGKSAPERDKDFVEEYEIHFENPVMVRFSAEEFTKDDGSTGTRYRFDNWASSAS